MIVTTFAEEAMVDDMVDIKLIKERITVLERISKYLER